LRQRVCLDYQRLAFAMWCPLALFLLSGVVTATRRAAVVIDITKEQYVGCAAEKGKDIWHKNEVLSKVEWLLSGEKDAPRWDAIFDCRNWIYNAADAAWGPGGVDWHGGVPGSDGAKLVPQLATLRDAASLPNSSAPKWRFVGKPTYSCLHDTTMTHALLSLRIDELYLMGLNTEQCIFMTAVDAWRSKAVNKVFLVQDATTSCYGEEGYRLGLQMLERVVGNGFVNSTDLALEDRPSGNGGNSLQSIHV